MFLKDRQGQSWKDVIKCHCPERLCVMCSNLNCSKLKMSRYIEASDRAPLFYINCEKSCLIVLKITKVSKAVAFPSLWGLIE